MFPMRIFHEVVTPILEAMRDLIECSDEHGMPTYAWPMKLKGDYVAGVTTCISGSVASRNNSALLQAKWN